MNYINCRYLFPVITIEGLPTFFYLVLGFVFVWLLCLSLFAARIYGHYQKLTKGIFKKRLGDVLTDLIDRQKDIALKVDANRKDFKELKNDLNLRYSRMGFMRFNPFGDTGGEQSFVWALLNDNDEGILMSSLHGRESTRMYAKKLKAGRTDLELSQEEKKVLKSIGVKI